MTAAERKLRECINAFSEDLAALAERAIRDSVALALARLRMPSSANQRRSEVVELAPQPRRKRLSALERLERETAQRQKRREKRSKKEGEAQLSLLELVSALEKTGDEEQGQEEQQVETETAASKPAPLFVHKRRRDGAIEPLSRGAAQSQTANGSMQPNGSVEAPLPLPV